MREEILNDIIKIIGDIYDIKILNLIRSFIIGIKK